MRFYTQKMAEPLEKWQDGLMLAICTIGFLNLSTNLYQFVKWVWSHFLRPPKKLTDYGSWAMITGSTDGIGKALAFELASKGLDLVLVGRNPQKLRATSNEVAQKFGNQTKIKTIVIDFDNASGEEIEERITRGIEGLDVGVLVNNAGSSLNTPGFFHEIDSKGENTVMTLVNVNVRSVTWVTKAVLPAMLKRKKGAIVNMGSGSCVYLPCFPLCTVYAATKSYMGMFSRSLAVEYKQYGIDIQCQTPLLVATNMTAMVTKTSSFFSASAEQYSKSSTRWIGYDLECCAYWTHSLLGFVSTRLVPKAFVSWLFLVYLLGVLNKEEEINKVFPYPRLRKIVFCIFAHGVLGQCSVVPDI